MFLFIFYRVFDEESMRWLTSRNGRTWGYQEIRIKRDMFLFEAIWMSKSPLKPTFAQEKGGVV